MTMRISSQDAGSSPRMRGKPFRKTAFSGIPGLIPAYAGKTVVKHATKAVGPAHPRVCGENQDENILNLTQAGSSPRMRGKPVTA